MDTSGFFQLWRLIFIAGFLSFTLGSTQGFAQSGAYKRKDSPAPAAPAAPAPGKGDAPASTGDELTKKVDTTDLEQKYWAAKDTEFSVVQNRAYSKEKRFAISGSLGYLVNDQYSKGSVYAGRLNYYLTERMGIEAQYMRIDSLDSKMTEEFAYRYGSPAAHNKAKHFYGVGFNWVPFYGKMSLLEKKIVYFDMAITPVVGFMTLDRIYFGKPWESFSTLSYGFDISQHYFIDQHWALRFDFSTRFYNESYYRAGSPFNLEGDRGITQQILMFGATYYF